MLLTMLISMLDNFQKWIIHCMKMYEWLDMSNEIWLSVDAYHDFTPRNEIHVEVSQWKGKAMQDLSWNPL